MAGDWIKLQHATPDKPEIGQMADLLNLDIDSVVGKCLRLWIWADQQSADGYALSVTRAQLDRITYCPGFADALQKVGWLDGESGQFSMPNYTRHNGQTAKKRALSQDRMQRKRYARSVTKSEPEKRREESISTTNTKRFVPPTVEQVREYCDARGNRIDPAAFVDHYTANGWMRGKNKLKDWKAAVRTWEKNQNDNRTGTNGQTRRLSNAEHREQANADAFEAVFGSGPGVADAVQHEKPGSVHAAPVGHLGGRAGAVPD